MSEDVSFAALDGYRLHGTLHGDPGAAHTALVFNSGTGIPRGFYRRFCTAAADAGFLVLSFDYRGIGDSAPDELSQCDAVYRDWGQLDVPGAIDYLSERAPGLPLVTVGHSTGGQQLGLSDRVAQVKAALFVGVSTGYWRGMPRRLWGLNLALWHIFVPLCGRLMGYFPARRFGLGESLPIGVAQEWGDWCLEPDYLAAYIDEGGRRQPRDGRPFGPQHFGDARFPIRALYFKDDNIATAWNVPPLLALYRESRHEVLWYGPDDFGGAIGHLGFFRKEYAAQWSEHLAWLRDRAHDESTGQ